MLTETMVEAVPVDAKDMIRMNVLKKLGNPKDVIKVDVKPISEHSYRVNVWTYDGDGLVRAGKITHSEVVTMPAE